MTTRRRVLAISVLVVLTALLMIGFGLLDAVVSDLGRGIAHFSLAAASSPGALNDIGQWQGWQNVAGGNPGPLIGVHLVLDVFYMLTYGALFYVLIDIGRANRERTPKAAARFPILVTVLIIALGCDVLEDIGLFAGSLLVDDGRVPVELAIAVGVASLLKWAGIALLVVLTVVHLVLAGVEYHRSRPATAPAPTRRART